MLRKYDTFFYFLTSISSTISVILYYHFNIPIEYKDEMTYNLSERLNDYYLAGKIWKWEIAIHMIPEGLGIVGIIWLTDLDIKIEWLYLLCKWSLKRWYFHTKYLYRRNTI